MSRMVCAKVLLLRKGKENRAEPVVLRLGDRLIPERHVRLVALTRSAGDAVAKMRLGHQSASGEINASGLSKI